MTKKDFLELIKELPDDAEIVFNTSQDPLVMVPMTQQRFYIGSRCTNLEYLQSLPLHILEKARRKYQHFLVINAMPLDYAESKLGITFKL